MKSDNHPSILIIYTGGTIGMIHDPETGALSPFNFDQIYTHIPILRQLHYNIASYCFDPLIDSSDMKPAFWRELVDVIEKNYESYDGFVVLHGTDTMAYSASVLSFLLENLNKPVVFTGSQLPLGMIRTDGRENFLTAIEIAAALIDDTPVVPEVCIYFENKLFRGNRVTKFNAEDFSAFLSENYPPLAEVGVHIKFNHGVIRNPNFKNLKAHKNLENNISILKLFPGITPAVVRSMLSVNGLRAMILETYGMGNAPTDQWFIEILSEAIGKGIIIFNVTQCKGGTVIHGKYASSLQLEKIGVISGYDITTESAVAKLMYLLAAGLDDDEVRTLLPRPLRGEMTIE